MASGCCGMSEMYKAQKVPKSQFIWASFEHFELYAMWFKFTWIISNYLNFYGRWHIRRWHQGVFAFFTSRELAWSTSGFSLLFLLLLLARRLVKIGKFCFWFMVSSLFIIVWKTWFYLFLSEMYRAQKVSNNSDELTFN